MIKRTKVPQHSEVTKLFNFLLIAFKMSNETQQAIHEEKSEPLHIKYSL